MLNTTCGQRSWLCNGSNKIAKPSKVVLVVSATISTILCFLWVFKKLRNGTTGLPSGPRGLPLVGYLPFLGTNILQSFMELAQVHGPIFKLKLGSKLCVVLSSPSTIKEVVRDQDTTFANRDLTIAGSVFSNGGSDIALAPYDLNWRKGTGLGAEFRAAVTKLSVLLAKPNVSDFFPVLARFDIQGIERKTKKITLWVEKIFDFVLDQRMKVEVAKGGAAIKNEGKDFLQFLLELKEKKDSETITLKQVKALLMDIVLGGTDTTATTVEWAMAEMLRHPEVMKRVHEELTSVVGVNNIVEECHLPKLQYLDAVVKETLRLHPVIPLLVPRSPSLSSTVGGYTIP
ncbi:hypothetical protein F0562_012775 [Nyssa sinensis]|uniref:Cytochrome P450 n=1 Tax=Nyssa sinensis TaxID=561372 RepID=A0A5J4ZXX9_9ASTE|nr:hypothetical protein F0562_012775 [Nyssa sinensis]